MLKVICELSMNTPRCFGKMKHRAKNARCYTAIMFVIETSNRQAGMVQPRAAAALLGRFLWSCSKKASQTPKGNPLCYRIPRPSNHTAGYRIPQGRTDMRFRATQLGRRLQRGHTLQRRCYVAAHSTQGTSRTPLPTKRLRGAADLYLLPNGAVREASLRMSMPKYPLTKFPLPVC